MPLEDPMTSAHVPPLTARYATLAGLVEILRQQHRARLDVVAPAGELRAVGGNLSVRRVGEPTITREGVTPGQVTLSPTEIQRRIDGTRSRSVGTNSSYSGSRTSTVGRQAPSVDAASSTR